MKIEVKAAIMPGQDGAVWKNFLFRFDTRGRGWVYDLQDLLASGSLKKIGPVTLLQQEVICPHSNAVFFGADFYDPSDPFPLLYTNVYNNCAGQADPKEGVCCVYRLEKAQEGFEASLVQLIRIGFTQDPLWRSSPRDVRPYGNFTADRDAGILYAFTMRDQPESTRYFSFRLPGPFDGVPDPATGVRTLVLSQADLLDWFDCQYHRYLQGACCQNGLIYSVEGFTDDPVNRPALRIIDPKTKKQLQYVLFEDYGFKDEAEMIDFYGNTCLYSDAEGRLFRLEL